MLQGTHNHIMDDSDDLMGSFSIQLFKRYSFSSSYRNEYLQCLRLKKINKAKNSIKTSWGVLKRAAGCSRGSNGWRVSRRPPTSLTGAL